MGFMLRQRYSVIFAFTLAIQLLHGCGKPQTSKIDVDLLASDRSVRIGGEVLTLPFVAMGSFVYTPMSFSLGGPSREQRDKAREERITFLNSAQSRQTAPKVESIEISISTYGTYGELGQSSQICPRLEREWSRSLCGDAYSPIYQALPREFELVEFGKFDKYKHHVFADVKQKTVYDQITQMKFEAGRSSVVCFAYDVPGSRPGGQNCRAGRLVGDHLVAIWEAWDREGGNERIQAKADREGRMIREFIVQALGPTENFVLLERLAVRMRSPDAPCWNAPDPYHPRSMARVKGYAGLIKCPL